MSFPVLFAFFSGSTFYSDVSTSSFTCYSGTSLKRTLTVPNILSALERCPPWRGFAYFDEISRKHSTPKVETTYISIGHISLRLSKEFKNIFEFTRLTHRNRGDREVCQPRSWLWVRSALCLPRK